jgi:ketosteroid isomerase-like protein
MKRLYFSSMTLLICMCTTVAAQDAATILEQGKLVSRELTATDKHQYQVKLSSGQLLKLVVTQNGVDLVVVVFDPSGKQIIEEDSPTGTQGQEKVMFQAQANGTYRIEVAPFDKSATAGRYEIKVEELRAATTEEKKMFIDEQELKEITQKRFDAESSRDLNYLSRVYADELSIASTEGRIASKEVVLGNMKRGPEGVTRLFRLEQMRVRVVGDTAIVTAINNIGVQIGNQERKGKVRFTDTYVRRQGNWQLLASHSSRMPLERQAAKVDPKIYDAYVGEYELGPGLSVTVTREGDRLMTQTSGQPEKGEVFPESETTFFYRGSNASVIFHKDTTGKVTHMVFKDQGQEIRAKKIK